MPSFNQATLTVGTHNIHGLAPSRQLRKAERLEAFWRAHNLDIVMVQEHHIKSDFYTIHRLQSAAFRKWEVLWSTNTTAAGRAGVAILIRRRLLNRGSLKLYRNSVQRANDGRLLALKARWGGHLLQLVNAYMPHRVDEQPSFITTRLRPLLHAYATEHPLRLWAGDFNFVHNPSLDRVRRDPDTNGVVRPTATATGTGARWSHELLEMKDVYRIMHPAGKDMSRFEWISHPADLGGQPPLLKGSARLDRWYVDHAHLNYVSYTRPTLPGASPAGVTTDHNLVTLRLIARATPDPTPESPPPPRTQRRLRVTPLFVHDPALVARFRVDVQALIAQAPAEDAALLTWTMTVFKREWRRLTTKLNREFEARHDALDTPSGAAVSAAYQAMVNAPNSQLTAAAEAYDSASRARAAAAAAAAPVSPPGYVRLSRFDRPSPEMSHFLHGRSATGPAGVRLPSGAVTTHPVRCASTLVGHYAAVSAAPTIDPAARAVILDAVREASEGALAGAADALGDGVITTADVLLAIDKCKSGTAPGPDGIPIIMFKLAKTQLAPFLARFYTAMFTTNTAPARFAHGVISSLAKGDMPTTSVNAQQMRPITVLDLMYRVLAKIQVDRLSPHLSGVIHGAQSAFIPGRSIADCIWLHQMVGAYLGCSPSEPRVITLSCDIAKAYDTVDRQFLWDVMEIMGVGEGFLRWCKLLYSNTSACAVFRGYTGSVAMFAAGARQGCPLAPLLFLFAIHALLVYLDRRVPRCVRGGVDVSASAFADDLNALVSSLAEVSAVEAALAVFGDASGLRLSVPKLKGYHLGSPDPGAAAYGIFQAVDSCRQLGVMIQSGTGRPTVDWQSIVKTLTQRCHTLSRCGLSAFDRALNVSAYGLNLFYFQGEFSGFPPPDMVLHVRKLVSKLVVRGLSPSSKRRKFTRLAPEMLEGPCVEGGFGVTPLLQHMLARHAHWGLRLIFGDAQSLSPALQLARRLVVEQASDGGWKGDPFLTLLSPFTSAQRLGPSVSSWVTALAALPPLTLHPALAPGDWCYDAPLWGNPFILAGGNSHGLCLERRDECAGLYTHQTRLRTLGDVLLFADRLRGIPRGILRVTHARYVEVAVQFLGPERTGVWTHSESSSMADIATAVPKVEALLAIIRPDWKTAALAALRAASHPPLPSTAPAMATAAASLLAHVGWQTATAFHPPAEYTVKWGTRAIHSVSDVAVKQRSAMAEYAAVALAPAGAAAAPSDPAAAAGLTRDFFSLCLAVPWDSKYRELVWLLVHNDLPLSDRMTGAHASPCACGFALPGRAHCFWDCPCVRPLRTLIRSQLVAVAPPGQTVTLQRRHIWLGARPLPDLHPGAWCVVCIAALHAMDSVRRTITRLTIPPAASGSGPPAAQRLRAIRAQAVRSGKARFLKLLHVFASRYCPLQWRGNLSATHPFVASSPTHPFVIVHLADP